MNISTRHIGSHGLAASAEGLGTMGMTEGMYGAADEAESIATIHRALELGVTHFDTADIYGPWLGERLVGRALAGHRDEIVLATKFGAIEVDEQGAFSGGPNGRPEYVRRSLEGSLRRLGTDHIDLYYQHRIDPGVPLEETFGTLGELVAEGKVGYLGISEATPDQIRRAHAAAPLSAVQIEYSLFARTIETNGVLDTVRELGLGFVAYSPLGRGMLTGALRGLDGLAETDWRRTDPRYQGEHLGHNLALVQALTRLAEQRGVTPGQLAIAWVLAQGDFISVIPGTKRRTNLEQNVVAASIELDRATLDELDGVLPVNAVSGDRYGSMEGIMA